MSKTMLFRSSPPNRHEILIYCSCSHAAARGKYVFPKKLDWKALVLAPDTVLLLHLKCIKKFHWFKRYTYMILRFRQLQNGPDLDSIA